MSINQKNSELEIKNPSSADRIQQQNPNYLPDDTLHLWKTWDKEKSPRNVVPSHTPNSEYDFEQTPLCFPDEFPPLDNLEIPFIRDKGVKYSIDALGDYFRCTDYKFNLLQFWFLDFLTDCLWTAQDDFHLPVSEQKIVLSWVLYLIDLIRDPAKNVSRRKFFTIFKEAMLLAAEVVDEGCETVPTPEKLFSLLDEEEEPASWTSSENQSEKSSLEIDTTDFDNTSCIELKVNDEKRRYVLPQELCNCSKYDLSSVDSIQENDSLPQESKEDSKEEIEDMFSNTQFYQPDPNIPARFLPLPEDVEEFQSETESKPTKPMCKTDKNNEDTNDSQATQFVSEVTHEFHIEKISDISERGTSDTTQTKSEQAEQKNQEEKKKSLIMSSLNKQRLERYNQNKILKGLAFQKLWELRLEDMEDPKKGWVPTLQEMEASPEIEINVETAEEEEVLEENEESDDDEWADIILEATQKGIIKDEDKLIVNFGVLRAIISFVFRYFYESFQFSLIKLAFQATPDVIFQKLNHDWKIPKRFKGELQKPKVEKKPKEKPPKKESSKKEAPKKGKDDKKKGKEDKKKDKKQEKGKEKKEEKKGKKEKPAALTKEEKAELERQKKEQERIEEELRKIEEQKRFMYPLTEAATDELFKEIFEDWVKVETKPGKSGKGDKKKKKK